MGGLPFPPRLYRIGGRIFKCFVSHKKKKQTNEDHRICSGIVRVMYPTSAFLILRTDATYITFPPIYFFNLHDMKSSSEIILKFILSEYCPSLFTFFNSRVDYTPDFQRCDYGYDSHGTHKSFFQESVILCNLISLFTTTRNYQNVLTLKYTW
jgi:hypothetical protein